MTATASARSAAHVSTRRARGDNKLVVWQSADEMAAWDALRETWPRSATNQQILAAAIAAALAVRLPKPLAR